MRFVYPDIEHVFETGGEAVPTLVLENAALLQALLTDVTGQIAGDAGRAVLSQGDKILGFDKHAELLDRFVPFEINRRSLLTKAASILEKTAVAGEHYLRTVSLLGEMQRFLQDLAFESLPGEACFSKLEIGALIKAAGLEFLAEHTSLCEQLLDYFELVTALERPKLFITLNLRALLNDTEAELFLDSVLLHKYNVCMIEVMDLPRLSRESRLVVDRDLCLIS